jgi:hypothetical protein
MMLLGKYNFINLMIASMLMTRQALGYCRTIPRNLPKNILKSSSSNTANTVKNMSPQDFDKILKGESRELYQIIDVREVNEIQTVSLKDKNVINLPLSTAGQWTTDVTSGKLLNSDKPAICLVN